MSAVKKAAIKIAAPKKEKRTVKRPIAVLIFLIFGVSGLMLYLDSIGGVTFSILLYPFSIILCAALWYIYFYMPKLLTPLLIITAAALAITGLLGYKTIYIQAMELGNALLGDSSKVRITLLCTIIALIIVFVLFLFEIAFSNHIILYLLTSFFIICAPVFGYEINTISYILLFLFQIAFIAVSATGASSKKSLNSPDCAYKICSKAVITSVAAVAVILAMVFYLVKGFANTLYESVYTAEGFLRNAVNSLSNYTISPYEDGSISKGNLYTSGNTTLNVSVEKIPKDTIYLKSFIGGEYTNSTWSKADDDEIIDKISDFLGWEKDFEDIELSMLDYLICLSDNFGKYSKQNQITVSNQFAEDSNKYVPYFSHMTSYSEEIDSNITSSYDFFSISDVDPEYYKSSVPTSFSFTITNDGYTTATTDLDAPWYYEFVEEYKRYADDQFTKVNKSNTPRLAEYCEEHPLNDLDEITAFIAYTLQSNTKYNKTPGMAEISSDVVEDFLFERRQGYCVHYASTAALMYRMYGVPARYVSGYSVSPDQFVDMGSALSSSIDEDGNPVSIDINTPFFAELTDEDAHAWVEIFLDGYGWVPVEFTPDSYGIIIPEYPSFNDTAFANIINEKGWNLNTPSIPIESSPSNSSTSSSFFSFGQSSKAAAIIILAVILMSAICFILIRRIIILRRLKKCPPKKMFTRLINMLNFNKFYNFSGDEENLADKLSLRFSSHVEPDNSVDSSALKKSSPYPWFVSKEDIKLMLEIYSEAAFGPDKLSKDKNRFLILMYRRLSLNIYAGEKSRIKRLIFKYIKAYV